MENKVSKRIKSLMVAILLLVLIPAAADFMSGFSRGLKLGRAEADRLLSDSIDRGRMRYFFVDLEPLDPNTVRNRFENGAEFITSNVYGELTMPAKAVAGWIEVVNTLLIVVAIAAMFTLLAELIRFTILFPRRRLVDRDNVRSLRRIALWLGTLGVAGYSIDIVQFFWLRGNLSLEGYRVVLYAPPSALVVALILVVMTEVLKLAGKLQNEQDLTI